MNSKKFNQDIYNLRPKKSFGGAKYGQTTLYTNMET